MKYLKRFADVLSGIAVLQTIIYLIGKFSTYRVARGEPLFDRLKAFFAPKATGEYRVYLILGILFLLSIIVGRIFERFPSITMAASLLPFIYTFVLFGRNRLTARPMLYIIIASIVLAANILSAIAADRADGKRRAYRCTNVCGLMIIALTVWIEKNAPTYRGMTFEDIAELDRLHIELARCFINEDEAFIYKIALLTAISLAASLLLRDIYFIDAIIALPPCIYSIYCIAADEVTTFMAIVPALPVAYFIFKLIVLFFEPTLKYYLPFKASIEKLKSLKSKQETK